MKILITDTNILFDLLHTGILPEFFALEYQIITTSFVIEEILDPLQKEKVEYFVRAGKLTVHKFTGNEIGEIEQFKTHRNLKRFTDRTIIWTALQMNAIILTGDKKIRAESLELGLQVHGILWVLELLVERQLIGKEYAIEILDVLKKINERLPGEDIERLFSKFRNKT